MKFTSIAVAPDGQLRQADETAAIAGWRSGTGIYWVDIECDQPEVVAAWLTGLGIDPELLELLQIDLGETKVLPLAGVVYMSYPIPAGEESRSTGHIGLLCLDRLLVTIHAGHEAPRLLDERLHKRARIREASVAGLVCALAVVHSVRLRSHGVALRKLGDELTDRMDSESGAPVTYDEILAFKRKVSALGAVVDEQLAVLEVLKVSNLPALPLERLAQPFQIAIEMTRATDREIERLDRRASDLQQRHAAAQQDAMNRRLALLTILSAIFMPLTLIVGVYGMNFEVMPELHFRYGYPMVLGVMAAISGGLMWYFRSRWWSK